MRRVKRLPKKLAGTIAALDSRQWWEAEDLLSAARTLAAASPHAALERFRRTLKKLPPAAIEQLEDELGAARRVQYAKDQAARPRRSPAQREERNGGWSLRLERVLCGKEGCDELHGPYWYGYRSLNGRTRKRYFGKKKPDAKKLAAAAAALLGKGAAGELERTLPKKKRKGRSHVPR
jgi:hypothetical protein